MKTKNSDIAVKIFLVVVAVILVGLIIAWSTGVFKDKRKDLNEGTAKINSAISSMAEFDLLIYDGASISGEALVELIETIGEKDSEFTITVETLATLMPSSTASAISYIGNKSTIPIEKDNGNYINPNGLFKGQINREENENITGLTFTQY